MYLGPCDPLEERDEIPDLWLQPGPDWLLGTFGGAFPSFCTFTFQIVKYILKISEKNVR